LIRRYWKLCSDAAIGGVAWKERERATRCGKFEVGSFQ
jgi:hypothetical protein